MKIAIYGAGSTGCFLGGLLSLTGQEVSLICRDHIKQEIISANGVRVRDYAGLDERIMPDELITQIEGSEQFELVFVTLKCHQLESSLSDFQTLTKNGATLYFMQNGLDSLIPIAKSLPKDHVKTGIIPFNVLHEEQSTFFRATEGDLALEASQIASEIKHSLSKYNFETICHDDMQSVSYGKLLLNINNALNAIADVPIKTELENPKLRKILSKAMREWLSIANAEGVTLYQYTKVKPSLIPLILRLPNFLFTRLAKAMLDIDPKARSSMWEDIQAGRKTEIDYLNGAIVARGRKLKIATPANDAICKAIMALENDDKTGSQKLLSQIV